MSCNAFLLPVLPEAIKSAYVDSTSVIANKYPHSSTWMQEKKKTKESPLRPPEKQMTLWIRNRTRRFPLQGRLRHLVLLVSQSQNLDKLEKKQSRKQNHCVYFMPSVFNSILTNLIFQAP